MTHQHGTRLTRTKASHEHLVNNVTSSFLAPSCLQTGFYKVDPRARREKRSPWPAMALSSLCTSLSTPKLKNVLRVPRVPQAAVCKSMRDGGWREHHRFARTCPGASAQPSAWCQGLLSLSPSLLLSQPWS